VIEKISTYSVHYKIACEEIDEQDIEETEKLHEDYLFFSLPIIHKRYTKDYLIWKLLLKLF